MPFAFTRPLAAFAWTSLAVIGSTGSGLAQTTPSDNAMQITVSPSGYERESNEALERQQKLLKRLEQSEHMIRSICINCGDEWKHQIYAPFHPLASLKPSSKTSDQAEN